tara:strand:+ start:91 stop:786 length:696 start_codon:yes stop_codon:yes gene_type:complete
MIIKFESLLTGAENAVGTAVIIDVFRAFTTAPILFSKGAKKLIFVADISEAIKLKKQGIGQICVGEVDGIKPTGFDFGNSPHEISNADVRGKTIIQSTRAGTVGVISAQNASSIYVASLVNAFATARVIKKSNENLISLVAMGWSAKERTDEDEICAMYIRNMLLGLKPDSEPIRKLILDSKEAQKFADPDQPHFHPEDLEIALKIDLYNFAIRVAKNKQGLMEAFAEYPD